MGSSRDPRPDRTTVRVTIYNQPYTLTVSGDPGEVEELAQSVDELMTGIARQSGNADANRVAVLACLHLADRLRGSERELAGLTTRVEEKSRHFSTLLDAVLE